MGILGKPFGRKEDPLSKQAATLVSAAEVQAISMFVPFLDEFPLLREADAKHWDFIMTVAGVFVAASSLSNLRLAGAREEALMESVAESFEQWNTKAIGGFEDCKAFFENECDRLAAAGHEPRFIASDAVGKWIVWNVLSRVPETQHECMLVRATGAAITHRFLSWWSE